MIWDVVFHEDVFPFQSIVVNTHEDIDDFLPNHVLPMPASGFIPNADVAADIT